MVSATRFADGTERKGAGMPRAYRCWLTPVALGLAVVLAATAALTVGLLSTRCAGCGLHLRPVASDRALQVHPGALVAAVALITVVGGVLQLLAVRPARPRFLVRSAALQTAVAAVGPAVLLGGGAATRLVLIALLAMTAFLPALGLSGVALLRLPRYRPIQRRRHLS